MTFLRPMNKQTVCKVELFDQTPAATGGEQPRYVVLVHFSEVALQIMKAKGQKADLEARKNAKNLTKNEWPNIARSGLRITHPTVDLDIPFARLPACKEVITETPNFNFFETFDDRRPLFITGQVAGC